MFFRKWAKMIKIIVFTIFTSPIHEIDLSHLNNTRPYDGKRTRFTLWIWYGVKTHQPMNYGRLVNGLKIANKFRTQFIPTGRNISRASLIKHAGNFKSNCLWLKNMFNKHLAFILNNEEVIHRSYSRWFTVHSVQKLYDNFFLDGYNITYIYVVVMLSL